MSSAFVDLAVRVTRGAQGAGKGHTLVAWPWSPRVVPSASLECPRQKAQPLEGAEGWILPMAELSSCGPAKHLALCMLSEASPGT